MTYSGIALEARVQRLFLAQGIFAERSLWPAADVMNHRLLATDIDVLVSEYSSGFHLTRRHVECKSGRHVAILDRVLWLNGVRTMLGADASYLVLETFNEDATDFARSLSIDIMTIRQLEIWEKALKIPDDKWPNRSDYRAVDPAKKRWMDVAKREGAPETDRLIRQVIQFVEIDSWRVFGYGSLNRLLRLLKDLSDAFKEPAKTGPPPASTRYCASALLVRLSQFLLAVCYDVSRVPVSDLRSYLVSRLIFGDQEPQRAQALVRNTVSWMSHALKDRGIGIPPEMDAGRLFQPPAYSEGFVGLVEKLLGSPNESRYLPIATETEQFGDAAEIDLFPRLRAAWQISRDLTALVKGFAIASLGVEANLFQPIRTDTMRTEVTRTAGGTKKAEVSSGQTKLKLDNP